MCVRARVCMCVREWEPVAMSLAGSQRQGVCCCLAAEENMRTQHCHGRFHTPSSAPQCCAALITDCLADPSRLIFKVLL